jgi:molybdate transport system ATP-binding protein
VSIELRFQIDLGEFRLEADMSFPSSGVTSLFGPSGSGKTSLLRAIAGLDHHPGGVLRVNGETWQQGGRFVPPHRRPVGYVFQEASLFEHLDVRGNLEYGLKRLGNSAPRISLEDTIGLLDIGPLLHRDPSTLSGGERQRVAIARALAVSPELLLMDEPLAAVDVGKKQEILPYIESLHRELDIPVIHVSHLPEEVWRLADHLVLLDSGRVLASGDVHDVFTRLDLPLALAEDASSIIEASVTGHDEQYHLTQLGFGGAHLTIARQDIPLGRQVRLSLAARDVSLTLERQTGTSILNILPASIDGITEDGDGQATVRLQVADAPILARITRKSAHDLQLEPGKKVYAQVKSIALLN